MTNDRTQTMSRRDVFADILYAQCWEDPTIDREAFRIGPDDVVFSITSGGCNVLAFLIDDPRAVLALDLSPYQNYLLKLKIAAFRTLDYEALLEFLGVTASDCRPALYAGLRTQLDPETRSWWDTQPLKIERGIIHVGRYEDYMRLLRTWFNRLMGRSLIREIFSAVTREERVRLYERKWDTLRWRLFTKVFLGRPIMVHLFDPVFYEQLEDSFSFGDHFREIIRHAITELPVRENTFLAYIVFGHFYSPDQLPLYLRREHFDAIRSRLDRVQITCGPCEGYFAALPPDHITKFNFTNIFEWMPVDVFTNLLRDTVRVAKNGAVLTYRNLLVPRCRPLCLAQSIEPQTALAQRLHRQDLSFIYRAYVVERVRK